MIPALSHHFGGDLFGSLARGFAWSVGWMLARGLGLPAAAALLAVGALVYWLRRRRSMRVDTSSRVN